jgi:hypothetical protein
MNRIPAAALGLCALAMASQALAHAHLTSSDPTAKATVASPKQITLHFTETLNPQFSGIELTMPQMANMAKPAKVAVSADKLSMVVTPNAPLPAGVYKVSWHAVTTDTHRTQGDFIFTVK